MANLVKLDNWKLFFCFCFYIPQLSCQTQFCSQRWFFFVIYLFPMSCDFNGLRPRYIICNSKWAHHFRYYYIWELKFVEHVNVLSTNRISGSEKFEENLFHVINLDMYTRRESVFTNKTDIHKILKFIPKKKNSYEEETKFRNWMSFVGKI